jgi:predicted RND superfamily exporter protein
MDAAPAPLGAGADAGGATPDPEQAAAARLSAAQKISVGQLLEALRFASTGTDAAEGTLGGRPADEVRAELELVATALLAPPEDAAAKGATLTAQVTGEPVLNEAFSRSVDKNQWASLGLALLSVLVVLLVAQRSLRSAVLSLLPAVLSLLIVFGVLGMSGRPIDLGTSLVGSIVTSSGADFAMHYIWYLRRQSAKEVVTAVGPVILTTAVLLGLGMGVLMLGASPPIRLFGGLSCAGMLLSAAFTFLLVPPLLGKLPGDVPEEPSGELQTPPASVP